MKLTDKQKVDIVKRYELGESNCGAIARDYGVTDGAINSLLKRRGIKIHNKSYLRRKFTLNENYFADIKTPEQAYWLGWLYADGYNDEARGCIAIPLQQRDGYILEEFSKHIGSNKPLLIIKKENNRQDIARFHVNSMKMSQQLAKLGCFQRKSLLLKFPTEQQVAKHLLPHFIKGYFDGDGCFHIGQRKNGQKYYSLLIVSTEDFCLTLKQIIEKELNIHCHIAITHPKSNTTTRTLMIAGRLQCCKFAEWIYQDTSLCLKRKYEKFIEAKSFIPFEKSKKRTCNLITETI